MYASLKTRSARLADLAPIVRPGFIGPADPINCIVEVAFAAEGADAGEAAVADLAGAAEQAIGQAAAEEAVAVIGEEVVLQANAAAAPAEAAAAVVDQVGIGGSDGPVLFP